MTIPVHSPFETETAGHVPASVATPPTPDGDAINARQQHGDTPTPSPLTRPLDESEAPETSGRAALGDLALFPAPCDTVFVRATEESSDGTPGVMTLRSALNFIDPNADPATRIDRCLAPLARAAREYPDLADVIKSLAYTWQCGDYWVEPCTGFFGRFCHDGSSFTAEFDTVWDQFLCADPGAQQLTLGTLYTDAAAAGWPALTSDRLYTEQQELEMDEERRELTAPDVEEMLDRIRAGDHNAPFDADSLDLLADFLDYDEAEYSRVKALIEQVDPTVSLTAIDEAVAALFVDEEGT